MKTQRKKYITHVFIVFVFVFLTTACKSISTTTYRIETPLIPETNSIKILLISDLHNTIYKKDQTVLINEIRDIQPDLIIMSGDIFHSTGPKTGAILLLSGISRIAPIYYVTGNHEYRSQDIQSIRDILFSFGVIILSDNYIIIEINNNEIILAGIEDPDRKFFEESEFEHIDIIENAFRELDDLTSYKILIAHRPENIKIYKKYSFDLVLSGHAHGGQIRIRANKNGLYSPNQGLFPKYSGGIYTHENLAHIVSRGLSLNYPKFPRINNPPELVIIILE